MKFFRAAFYGYTLVELLVVTAVSSFIILGLFTLLGHFTETYDRSHNTLRARAAARAFFPFFERDLASLLPEAPLYQEWGSGGGIDASDQIAFVRADLTEHHKNLSEGDLSLTFYYVAFSSDGAGSDSPKLFRSTSDPVTTQSALNLHSLKPFLPADLPLDDPIFANVLHFSAQLYSFSGNPATKQKWTNASDVLPDRIELQIRFLDEAIAHRYHTREEWNRVADSPKDSEKKHIRNYRRTFLLKR